MSIRLFRLVPVFLSLVVLTWFLPKIYLRTTMGERWTVSGQYSPVLNDFIIWNYTPAGLVFRSKDGKKYPKMAARKLMPFVFYNDALKNNAFPLIFGDRSFSYQDATQNHIFRLYPQKIFKRHPQLYFLMESEPKTAGFSLPDDVLILDKDKVRFISCATGKGKKKKSALFTQEMRQAGAKFPVLLAANNPDNYKPFDDGLFFIDSKYKLFQLKQINGAPFCRYMNYTFTETPLFINIEENTRKEYCGQVVTPENIHLIRYEKKPVRLPLPAYNAKTTSVMVWNKPVYKTLILKDIDIQQPTQLLATTPSWTTQATHKEPTPNMAVEHKKWQDAWLSILTPFRLSQHLPHKAGTILCVQPAPYPLLAVISCLVAALFYNFLRREHPFQLRKHIKRTWAETLLVVLFGFPGLTSLLLFGPLTTRLDTK